MNNAGADQKLGCAGEPVQADRHGREAQLTALGGRAVVELTGRLQPLLQVGEVARVGDVPPRGGQDEVRVPSELRQARGQCDGL
jgi:hypothetical protein